MLGPQDVCQEDEGLQQLHSARQDLYSSVIQLVKLHWSNITIKQSDMKAMAIVCNLPVLHMELHTVECTLVLVTVRTPGLTE